MENALSSRLRTLLAALKAESKDGRVTTAQSLAEKLGVSVRTLYRDIDRLRAAGLPIDGKTGVGIRIDKSARLPDEVPGSGGRGGVEAKARVTARGLRMLATEPLVSVGSEDDDGVRVLRGKTREAIVRAALCAAGAIVIEAPNKLRREVRTRARQAAKSHK